MSIHPNTETISYKGNLVGYSSEELHTHELHQFLYISKGVSMLIDHKYQQPHYGSQAALIPMNVLHRSIVMGPELEFQTIFINKNLFDVENPFIRIFNLSDLGKALFDHLCKENRKNFARGYLGQCLQLFLDTMMKDINNKPDILSLPVPKDPVNIKVANYIHQNYKQKIQLEDLGKKVNYSMRHVSRIFQKEMHMSIFKYLKIYRILMATIMLNDLKMPVNLVAYETGYETLSNFYKDFNYLFNISPGKYRERFAI
ncbi:MAG: helix-turn-helix domain-containing protein [Bacteroidales bacterium]|nr:helix-turn-helix domain-containing protein [Bacteroidales bacterium]